MDLHKLLSKNFNPKEVRFESDPDSKHILAAYTLGFGLLSELNKNKVADLISKPKPKAKKRSSPIENLAKIAKINKEKNGYTKMTASAARHLIKNNLNKNTNDDDDFLNKEVQVHEKYETIPMRKGSIDHVPIIPVHTTSNGNSKDYYMENLFSCKGALGLIALNKKSKKDLIDYYITDFKNNTKIDYLLNDNRTQIDFENLIQIAQEYLTYITTNNIKTAYNNTLIDFFKNFTEFSVNEIFFGDEYNYLTSLVVSVTLENLIKNFDTAIKTENKSVYNILSNFKKTGKLDLNKLEQNYKFNLIVTDKNIFWGLIVFMQKMIKKHIDLPLASSSFQVEIFKNKDVFDINNFLIQNEKFYADLMSSTMDDMEKFRSIKDHEHENSEKVKSYVTNPDLWIIKLYYNQEMIYTSTYKDFKQTIEQSLIGKEIVKDFCLGKQNNLLFTISIILVALIGFLTLSLICIYMICLK